MRLLDVIWPTHTHWDREEDATIPYALEKVIQSMDEQNLVLTGPNGLILCVQEGTRGELVLCDHIR